MKTYGTLQKAFERAKEDEEPIASATTRRLRDANWLDDLADPFARWLLASARRAGYDDYRVNGPFGIGARLSITLMAVATQGQPADEWDNPRNLRITVEPSGTPIRLATVDYETDNGCFAPNWVGALSGLNHPSKDVADEATAEAILAPLLAAKARTTAPRVEAPHPMQTEMFATAG